LIFPVCIMNWFYISCLCLSKHVPWVRDCQFGTLKKRSRSLMIND